MKKISILFLFVFNVIFSQDEATPFTSNENAVNNVGERFVLYNIDVDGLTIPLEILYNHNGFKATEIPGILGLGWQFNNIGKITRQVNHLPDEFQTTAYPTYSTGGWFVNDNSHLSNTGNLPTGGFGNSIGDVIRDAIDISPDFYSFNSSSGRNALFSFDKIISNGVIDLKPVFLDSNLNYTLDTDFNKFNYGLSNYQDVVFNLIEENGVAYEFIGGPINSQVYRNQTSVNPQTKDFYVSKIKSSHNSDEINISYVERLVESGVLYDYGYKNSTSAEAIVVYSDYFFRGESELIVSEIITPKEKIVFEYFDSVLPNYSGYGVVVPTLHAIYIRNLNDEIITSYHFVYEEFITNIGPLLTKIYKGEKDFYSVDHRDFYDEQSLSLINITKIKEFQYYEYSQLDSEFTSHKIDIFGYYNASNNNSLLPVNYKICRNKTIFQGADRKPNLAGIKQGVLKKAINNLGGIKEYDYTLNAEDYGNNFGHYGGGLKISKIIDYSDENTSTTTTFEYSDYKGFGVSLFNPEFDMIGGYVNGRAAVKSYINDEIHDHTQEASNVDHYQKNGNFFGKIKSKKFIETIYDPYEDLYGEVFLETTNYYRSNFKTFSRTPLIEKVEVAKGYYFDGYFRSSALINKKEYTYDLINYSYTINSNRIYGYSASDCNGDYFFNYLNVFNRPIRRIEMPLKSIEEEKYIMDENGNSQIVNTKSEIKYFGENDPNYPLNVLRPKEIIHFKNNIPVSKKKYKYIVEEFVQDAGLYHLSDFNSAEKTIISHESDWLYDENEWILKYATFYEYLSDGKIKSTSSTTKANNNTFFNETNFNPHYFIGELTGVPLFNRVEYEYDFNGKISIIKNLESGHFKMLYRDNDFNSNLINTVLEGNTNTSTINVYRNSFENSTGSDFLETNLAYTGNKVFSGYSFYVGMYPKKFIISYWYYKDNKWHFESYSHGGGHVYINMPSGALYIDEVWIRPNYTNLYGKVYNKFLETTHLIDDKGFTVKNLYDDFGRLLKQVDKDGNLINERIYNFTQE